MKSFRSFNQHLVGILLAVLLILPFLIFPDFTSAIGNSTQPGTTQDGAGAENKDATQLGTTQDTLFMVNGDDSPKENPDLTIEWLSQPESVAVGATTSVRLRAALTSQRIAQAQVMISFSQQEIAAMEAAFPDGQLVTDAGVQVVVDQEHGISFELNTDHRELDILIPVATQQALLLDVAAEDMIVVPTMAADFAEMEPVIVRTGGVLSVVEPEPVFSWSLNTRMPQTLPAGAWENAGFTLSMEALADNAPTQRLQVDVSLLFPEGLSLPAGTYTYDLDDHTLSSERGEVVAILETDGATVEGILYDGDNHSLDFRLVWVAVPEGEKVCTFSFTDSGLTGVDSLGQEGGRIELHANLLAESETGLTSTDSAAADTRIVCPAGTVQVTKWMETLSQQVGYLDAEGNAIPRLETAPTFTLYYTKGEDAPAALSEDTDISAAGLGLAAYPQRTISADAQTWTFSVPQEQLPAEISVADGLGGETLIPVEWHIAVSGAAEHYTLVFLEETDLPQYSGATEAGWYYIREDLLNYAPADIVEILQYNAAPLLEQIYWADNNDEEGIRPENADSLYALQFAMDGSSVYKTVTAEDIAALGLSQVPRAVLQKQGIGVWQISLAANTLPTQVVYTDEFGKDETHTVAWRLAMQDADGYDRVEVTEENQAQYPSVSGQWGTYYVLLDTFQFTVELRRGLTTIGWGITEAFLNQFYFHAQYGTKSQSFVLAQLGDASTFEAIGDPLHPNTAKVSIQDTWRYNLDNTRINYFVAGTDPEQKLVLDSLPEGDFFTILYDNSAVPNFGSVLDQARDGGTVFLTLTGTTTYTATKVWLDSADSIRPQGELQLWRYRCDQPYTTAAPLRDASGEFVVCTLNGEDTQILSFSADLDGDGVVDSTLPKYDPEGYEYIYVAREYLTTTAGADPYAQVFGSIQDDGSVLDTVGIFDSGTNQVGYPSYIVGVDTALRDERNTFLYNQGTLSNRIIGSIGLSATKQWEAAAFQSEFEEVAVQLKLQSRPAGSTEAWIDVGKTIRMEDFYEENLTETQSVSMPLYDAWGKKQVYRWVEDQVLQNGQPVPSQTVDGRTNFTLTQAGREIIYTSTSTVDSTGNSNIVNTIANTIRYVVSKQWLDANGEDISQERVGQEVRFTLYRSADGNELAEYVAFTMDGEVDAKDTTVVAADDWTLTIRETEPWQVVVEGLPEFDTRGSQYEYILVETETGTLPNFHTERDEQGYRTTVINSPGAGRNILVRKNWIDDSDVQHREPVEITVYDRDTNEKIRSVTLGDGIWYAFVGIGQRPDGSVRQVEDVYVLETQVGGQKIPLQTYFLEDPIQDAAYEPIPPVEYTGTGTDTYTQIQYTTENHDYEASYTSGYIKSGDVNTPYVYTVTNRRLGKIDLTVTKTWLDGDGTAHKELQTALEEAGLTLGIKLVFASPKEGYNITNTGFADGETGDTITISTRQSRVPILDQHGNPADSIQRLQLEQETKEQIIYFYNLPKYDRTGVSVHYTVEEVIVDAAGAVVSAAQLQKEYPALYAAYREYAVTYLEGAYVVGEHRASDKQSGTITNRLQNTKPVEWYCLWKDAYVYESNQRPDIYLDIYRQVHTMDETGQLQTRVELVQANYKWEYDDLPGTDKKRFWIAQLGNMPKYDELGYEIQYFAVERTTVTATDFSYQPVQYGDGKDTTGSAVFGTAAGVNVPGLYDPYLCDISGVAGNTAEPYYALREGCTFINTIAGTIVVEGSKLWQNLPGNYPAVDLPGVTFLLDRSLHGDSSSLVEGVASLTVTDWESVRHNSVYGFRMEYEGENQLQVADGAFVVTGQENAPLLPRFDDLGQLYSYTLREKIHLESSPAGAEQAEIYTTTLFQNNRTIVNNYQSPEAGLWIQKYLTVPQDLPGYPAITLKLTRTYTKNNGEPSEEETVQSLTWDAADVQAAVEAATAAPGEPVTVQYEFSFADLPLYAPNGAAYVYQIQEDPAYLGGYKTWTVSGDATAAEIKNQGLDTPIVGGLQPHTEPGVDASFLNEYIVDRENVNLTGTKNWQDFNDTFGFRPDTLTITLSRFAASQPGQNNAIAEEAVSLSGDMLQWEIPSEGNRWTYTITDLERYAPNGMPWQYRVRETLPAYYTSGASAGQEQVDASGNIQMQSLTNSIQKTCPFQKSWVDASGNPITQDYLDGTVLAVTFGLQVRTKNTDANWVDAQNYFQDTLTAADWEELFPSGASVFTQTVSGTILDPVWKRTQYFRNLPTYVRDSEGNVLSLEYRVVEQMIRVYADLGEAEPILTQTFTVQEDTGDQFCYNATPGPFSPWYGPDADHRASSATIHYNMLQTTDLVVEKYWVNDSGDFYGTRPVADRLNYDWKAEFVIQRSTDGITWEEVTDSAGTPHTVTLYGTKEQDHAAATVTDLPAISFVLDGDGGILPYQYRVRELSVDAADTILDEGDLFHTAYRVSYSMEGDTHTATNTLENTTFTATKQWTGAVEAQLPSVNLELMYLAEDGVTWCSFEPAAIVTLDGKADDAVTLPYFEMEPNDTVHWNAIWTNVPLVLAGSAVDAAGHTQYGVFEVNIPAGYQMTSETGPTHTTITNFAPGQVDIPVKKIWLDNRDAFGDRPEQIQLELWADGEPTGEKLTLTAPGFLGALRNLLLEEDVWTGVFQDLPEFNEEGERILYTVREVNVPDGYTVQIDGLTVTNTHTGNLVVTKQVTGDGGELDRDFHFTITLSDRTITGQYGDVEIENGVGAFTLRHAESVRIEDLPSGISFIVEETDANQYGYTLLSSGARGAIRPGETMEAEFINWKAKADEGPVLISVQGTKVWKDHSNAYGTRPKELTLILERKPDTESDAGWEVVKDVEPVWTQAGDCWTFVYESLPSTTDGESPVPYLYRVREVTPASYISTVQMESPFEFHFTNTLTGRVDIPVKKIWLDNRDAFGDRPEQIQLELLANGEPTGEKLTLTDSGFLGALRNLLLEEDVWTGVFQDLPEFNEEGERIQYAVQEVIVPDNYTAQADGFTVTNTHTGSLTVTKFVTGDRGESKRDFHFKITLSDPSITGAYGDVHFENGIGTFSLRHTESVRIEELPAGIAFTVMEIDANRYGYRASSVYETGRIRAGHRVEIEFINHRDPVQGEKDPVDPPPGSEWDPMNPPPDSGVDPVNPPYETGGNAMNPPATGDTARPGWYLVVMGCSIVACAAFVGAALHYRKIRRGSHRSCR